MTEEVMQGFVKEAWTDNTLQGFSQRYMVLSKIAHQAIENNEETDTETRKKIRRHILILWRNTTRFPKIQKKAMHNEGFSGFNITIEHRALLGTSSGIGKQPVFTNRTIDINNNY